jgi:hypothetical protein
MENGEATNWQRWRKGKRRAKNWYRWLWLSPFLTVPTAIYIDVQVQDLFFDLLCPSGWGDCNWGLVDRLALSMAILVSALWHLILLIPALDKESEFVRWHGRQALILAGVRTAVPLGLVLAMESNGLLLAVPLLIIIWLAGNMWSQNQAKRGDCSLARRFGHEEALPPPEPKETPAAGAPDARAQALVEVIRSDPNKLRRTKVVRELHHMDPRLVAPTFEGANPPTQNEDTDQEIKTLVEVIRRNPDKIKRNIAVKTLADRGLTDLI